MKTFYEFFAGGGMANAGLGPGWQCVFANDLKESKARAYRENWGSGHLVVGDVADVRPVQLPGQADLAWASFPCQDLSLAGNQQGLIAGTRSACFWPFWELMRDLRAEGRAPRSVVLENVCGAITARGGRDFAALCGAVAEGYLFGAMVVDAKMFLPQSRPRLFIVGIRDDLPVPASLHGERPNPVWHTAALRAAVASLEPSAAERFRWWSPAAPEPHGATLASIVDNDAEGLAWHDAALTARLLGMMSPTHQAKVEAAKACGVPMSGALVRRMRPAADDGAPKVQRAEVRFDGVAGCLRTPGGGSSRQVILAVHGQSVRSRLISPREAMALMGLPDYRLPAGYSVNDSLHLAGDGVAAPVVRFLASTIVEPALDRRGGDYAETGMAMAA